MKDQLTHDVFLCHSSKGKAVIRLLAEQLRLDGLKAPFHFKIWNSDCGFAQPGRLANAFGSCWAQLGPETFWFRDPLNHEKKIFGSRDFHDPDCMSGLSISFTLRTYPVATMFIRLSKTAYL